ncbi:hypothetical protein SAMN06296429_104141 [Janibacter indicus]|uniref:Uncharacterized protein n=1 Tax=Janibacter indicus TaxID=857417 RepID=A0A1W1ZPU4_9MICO|nr:hypothetical protein SAMN06296429_104141 [Janibacter indicus]
MHIELMVFLGWASVPVVAYGAGMSFLRLRGRKTVPGDGAAASARLEELRRRAVEAGASRGRMAEAIRLADGPVAASLTNPRA